MLSFASHLLKQLAGLGVEGVPTAELLVGRLRHCSWRYWHGGSSDYANTLVKQPLHACSISKVLDQEFRCSGLDSGFQKASHQDLEDLGVKRFESLGAVELLRLRFRVWDTMQPNETLDLKP